MNVDYLLTNINRGLNVSKKPIPDIGRQASTIAKQLIRSSSANIIFGDFFGSCVYRFTKHMQPVIAVKQSLNGYYVSSLQFVGGPPSRFDDAFATHFKIANLNAILEEYDYEKHAGNKLIDLSDIQNITFKI